MSKYEEEQARIEALHNSLPHRVRVRSVNFVGTGAYSLPSTYYCSVIYTHERQHWNGWHEFATEPVRVDRQTAAQLLRRVRDENWNMHRYYESNVIVFTPRTSITVEELDHA